VSKSALCAIAALAASSAAWAADAPVVPEAVSVLTPIAYSSEAVAPSWIRDECKLEQQVAHDIGAALARQRLGGTATTSAARGNVLKLTIERVVGQRGGGWSGPKTLSLSVQLMRDGQVVGMSDETLADKSRNPLAGTCASFEVVSEKLSKRIVKWLTTERPGQRATATTAMPASASVFKPTD
jgi:hypothetical protein